MIDLFKDKTAHEMAWHDYILWGSKPQKKERWSDSGIWWHEKKKEEKKDFWDTYKIKKIF